jgi:hypothetical protein
MIGLFETVQAASHGAGGILRTDDTELIVSAA